ncbi:MAG: zinc ribbon domain-containing protein [Deltaproteobacteria bacterium]|nr:zinc ribbon domain-containing protein [Deltaproteobacteria bacterium]
MKCPYCEKEIPGKTCPDCGATMPEEARYCMQCGNLLDDADETISQNGEDDLDFENRVLCPDGTCTGIIVDGKCTECGRTFTPEEPAENGEGEGVDV